MDDGLPRSLFQGVTVVDQVLFTLRAHPFRMAVRKNRFFFAADTGLVDHLRPRLMADIFGKNIGVLSR